MQIFRFDREQAKTVDQHSSHGAAMLRILRSIRDATIAMLYIEPGGELGVHPSTGDQFFMVVQGEGWVTGANRRRVEISAGQAAFWVDGEWHASGSETGMGVVLVEAETIDTTYITGSTS
jgi:quercetin dioxygenase-like cupin family protein